MIGILRDAGRLVHTNQTPHSHNHSQRGHLFSVEFTERPSLFDDG